MRAIQTTGSKLRLVAALRRAAREPGGPLPSIAVADALLDERRELNRVGGLIEALSLPVIPLGVFTIAGVTNRGALYAPVERFETRHARNGSVQFRHAGRSAHDDTASAWLV